MDIDRDGLFNRKGEAQDRIAACLREMNAGRTLEDRLAKVGLLDRWNVALRKRDRAEMISLLGLAELSTGDKVADLVLGITRV
jgi:hypothetical protein